jgi:uncharacterized repeat protein (TIGR01451 family)
MNTLPISHALKSCLTAMIRWTLLLGACAWLVSPVHGAAALQGQSFGNTNWISGNLTGWRELDLIPFRIHLTAGPASNQTYTIEFDHTKTAGGVATPGIQDLFDFAAGSNVMIIAGPTLSAPAGSDTWSYTLTVNYTSAAEGSVEFRARLAAGAHNFSGSSMSVKGSGSLGLVQIAKPGATTGTPDLSLSKIGPAIANPGQTITYVLNYSNNVFASAGTGVQVRDVLPPLVSFVSCSGGCDVTGNTITWDLGTVPRGSRGTFTYQVVVTNTAMNDQTFENSAGIYSAENDANPGDNFDSVITRVTGACVPPVIAADPSSSTNCPGSPATFAVIVNGTSLNFQWRKDGTNIPGATAASYDINSVSAIDAGLYDVLITNICGRATSTVASLSVYAPTTADPLVSQTNCAGTTVTFSATAYGEGPFAYRWFHGAMLLIDETNSSLTRSNITAADAGVYVVEVTGHCNTVTNSATLTVNASTTASEVTSLTVCPGEPALFGTIAGGTGPFTYQWFKEGTPLLVETNSSLIINAASALDAGSYCVEVSGLCNRVTNCAVLTVNTNTSASALTDLALCLGERATFSTVAEGTGPLTYQWTFNGTNISGANESSYSIPSVTFADAGNYCVVVSGACNSVTNCAALRVLGSAIAVTKNCPAESVAPGEFLLFTGSVSNAGDVALTNVIIVNDQPAPNTIIMTVETLQAGEIILFTNAYRVPANSCGPYNDTLTATAISTCGISVTNSVSASCPGITTPSIVITKNCPAQPTGPGEPLVFTGSVSNSGNVSLTNVVVLNNQPVANTPVFGPVSLAPGEVLLFTNSYRLPPNFCGPADDTLVATATSTCGVIVSNSASASCPVVTTSLLRVTKSCPLTPIAPGELLTFSGTVTNAGNITLTNVVVVNDQPAPNTPLLQIAELPPGEAMNFAGSYRVPLDACGPWIDTITATATSICGSNVSHSATASCEAIIAPQIVVTKTCPSAGVALGELLMFTGSVSNAGNVTLTNVLVVNDQPVSGTPVMGPLTLAPGQAIFFTNSYIAPPDICDSVTDTLTATGTSICGSNVSHSASASCAVFSSPAIRVTKECPPAPPTQGSLLVFSGSVSNAGNITLTNVIVANNQPAPNTPVLGPITLAPGQLVRFTNSYPVPPDSCGSLDDTLTATATSLCGSNVSNTASASCPVLTTPLIRVTKRCPPSPVSPGDLFVFTGSVSNAGYITLTNVIVVNNQPTNNTPVVGPFTLAPGQVVLFTNSYTAPLDRCVFSDTLTATATSTCGQSVTHRASAICFSIVSTGVGLLLDCPIGPAETGQPLTLVGTVGNPGNVSITNVIVVNNFPFSNTVVLGPITLAPNERATFTNTFQVPADHCGPWTTIYSASARNICGTPVSTIIAGECPTTGTNCLRLTRACPEGAITPGASVPISGTVSNVGSVAATNVVLTADDGSVILSVPQLAPHTGTNYNSTFVVTNCSGTVTNTVRVSGYSTSYGAFMNDAAACIITCDEAMPLVLTPSLVTNRFVITFPTEAGRSYLIERTDSLSLPIQWTPHTNVIGTGFPTNIFDNATNAQRFFRIVY